MLAWRFLVIGLLGAWVGAMLFFGMVVAPAAFAELPTRELAGRLAGRVLERLDLFGAGVAVLVAASALAQAGLGRGAGAWMLRLGLAILVLCMLAGSFKVTHGMRSLRAEMGVIDQVAENHPLRLAFGRLHRVSVRLYGGTLIVAVALFCLEAREAVRP
jgi:hypothetical protein